MIASSPEETAVVLVSATDKALRRIAERNRGTPLVEFRSHVVNVVFVAVIDIVEPGLADDRLLRVLHALVDACVTLHAGSGTDHERLCIDFDAIARRLHGERDTDPSDGAPA